MLFICVKIVGLRGVGNSLLLESIFVGGRLCRGPVWCGLAVLALFVYSGDWYERRLNQTWGSLVSA